MCQLNTGICSLCVRKRITSCSYVAREQICGIVIVLLADYAIEKNYCFKATTTGVILDAKLIAKWSVTISGDFRVLLRVTHLLKVLKLNLFFLNMNIEI